MRAMTDRVLKVGLLTLLGSSASAFLFGNTTGISVCHPRRRASAAAVAARSTQLGVSP